MTVIGFTGFAQSGKDTAAGFLIEQGFKRLAFADALRDSVYNLNPIVLSAGPHASIRVKNIVDTHGWDVAKVEYPEIRALLQRMGTEVGRELFGESFWVDRVLKQITGMGNYVITDVRFPNEAAAIRSFGNVYRIVRPGTGAVNGHVSDTGIANLNVDGEIINDGDLEALKESVLAVAFR